MTHGHDEAFDHADVAPGDEHEEGGAGLRVLGYLAGLGLAILLTATSFFVAGTDLVWEPSIPVALVVLAIAQMGVHLVFFLHITTGPDNTNNVLALAFGVASGTYLYRLRVDGLDRPLTVDTSDPDPLNPPYNGPTVVVAVVICAFFSS